MNLIQLTGSIELGLIYGLVSLAVYISSKIIRFSDMTIDGTFTFGAAAGGVLMTNNIGPEYGLLCAFLGGCIIGGVTGILVTRFKIADLLAGILVMTSLFSINLRIMGRPNIAFFGEESIYGDYAPWVLLSGVIVGVSILCGWILKTNIGLGIRSIRSSEAMARANGIYINYYLIGVICFCNGLVSVAGYLMSQLQGFSDISMGIGTLVTGLAAVIIGESCVRSKHNIALGIIGSVVGAILFRVIITIGLNASEIGLKSSDLNLITSIIVIGVSVFSMKIQNRRLLKEGN